ncbi:MULTISPECIES: MFS transporter [Bifidobacterium]|jgi:MFS family permease|uniref:MFS transporter n=1 Tax=Bifidobacterium tibiigranuli TaxID=2172043 RepID=A0A5N6RXD3_9BIFI|nr:MFS transporter [Bifidobacterium tibiigranuli]KAE8127086.1 MFS transporter [Bifidobacterium tibiigranuli]KAE8127841.1 MFS transporter [Bifidobacterium tibiigranuli]MCI1211495.1 MFS transporter [Bifidobacterium tibiigranuli]MCI1221682.1 MFS transporter [Bifidobacterium tibiigranuli]MCI1232940.1 MFS transporter [Bifidobacterium tibiigranuli]
MSSHRGLSTGNSAANNPSTGGSSPYAELFTVPGSKAFCLSGAVARLPMSMMSLGIVLALNHLYGNWTTAGTMSAAYILALAAVTPLYARLFDRFGQRRVGRVALVLQVIAMLVFAFAALLRVPIALLFALAVLMGLTQFSFGALVRTRWAYALRGAANAKKLNTAYALESAIDEMVFILGPILAAFLATSVHPVSQLFVPTLACGIGGAVFFSLKGTQPPVVEMVEVTAASRDDVDVRDAMSNGGAENAAAERNAAAITVANSTVATAAAEKNAAAKNPTESAEFSFHQLHRRGPRPKSVLLYQGILPLLLVFVTFNMSFSAFDVSVTAMMKAMGKEQLLGLQLAMFAVGSCVGGLIFGVKELKGSNWRHMVEFLTLLTLGYVLIRFAMGNLILLGFLSVLSGLCVAPVFATGNLIVKNTVPSRSLTEGLSWITTAGQVGASLGSTFGGIVLDVADYHTGMLLPCATTFVTLVLAVMGWMLARRHTVRTEASTRER